MAPFVMVRQLAVGVVFVAISLSAQNQSPAAPQESSSRTSTSASGHKTQATGVVAKRTSGLVGVQVSMFGSESERWRNFAGPSQKIAQKHEVTANDYVIHQELELGGHIVNYSGSSAMWDNLVNVFSGPRFLTQSLSMHAIDHKGKLFDDLSMQSFGYGGDPNTSTLLRFSKGRIYTFDSLTRRDRQYFDYDLLANPMIPATPSPYLPVLNSPHLFNTVRKMGNYHLTLLPFARVNYRLGYSPNIMEGPTFSTVHEGTEGLLRQNWRNSTDTYTMGIDWRMLRQTNVSFDEIITHYKGDTTWSLAGLDYQLPNGAPVSLGIDPVYGLNTTTCKAFVSDGSTSPPTANPTCSGFLSYTRRAPTRIIYPTEQLHFESTSLKNVQMTGRIVYSGSHGNLNNYNETYNGLGRGTRETITTGGASMQLISVAADYGVTWQISPRWTASDAFNFWDFRDPGTNSLTTTTFTGTSMLNPPVPAPGGPVTTQDNGFLAQKTKTNTTLLAYAVNRQLRVSAGYRYRSRTITYGTDTPIPIHENWGLFGARFQPVRDFAVNFTLDVMSADRAYTRISPRQMQDYKIYTTFHPHPWLNVSGSITIFESRDNVTYVNHLQHNRDYSFGATVTPNKYWSIDAHYAYTDYFTRTNVCYYSTPPPAGAPACPTDATGAPVGPGNPAVTGYYAGNGLYNEPTNFGTITIGMQPIDRFTANLGYTASAVDGNAEYINPRQVPGSLQSIYETPFANASIVLTRRWLLKLGWAYNEYGEGSPVGPTAPRSFRGNLATIAAHYSF